MATTPLNVPALALALALVVTPSLVAAQVQTDVPAPVPGAKPAIVERIKIHGASLEGNLEGDAVDRDVIVFLPSSYATEVSRRYRSCTPCMATPSVPSSGRTRFTCRRRSKARSRKARTR